MKAKLIITVLLLVLAPLETFAQVQHVDSLATGNVVQSNYKFQWKQTILPATLIAAGSVALAPGFIRNGSRSLTDDIISLRGQNRRLEFDDYVQYLPVAGSLLLGCSGIEARHSFVDRCFIVATSYAALGVLTNIPKFCIDERRPEYAGHNSFPSGHTATAFMGAELIRIEYGICYGVGAYTVAAGIGFLRMYNGRHWFHDVVAGAGVGILSARIGEWSCGLWQKLLGTGRHTRLAFTPVAVPFGVKYYGVALTCSI